MHFFFIEQVVCINKQIRVIENYVDRVPGIHLPGYYNEALRLLSLFLVQLERNTCIGFWRREIGEDIDELKRGKKGLT